MKQTTLLAIIIAIAAIFGIFIYGMETGDFVIVQFPYWGDDDCESCGDTTNGDTATDESTTTEGGYWQEVGSGSEWTFIGGGDFSQWNLDFGDDWIPGKHKIEISRRWNFKDVFECDNPGSVVWCLRDSYDNQIWHREDTTTILNYVTDTIYSGVYDGTPWTFFIGNNYPCDIDPHWSVTFYRWVE